MARLLDTQSVGVRICDARDWKLGYPRYGSYPPPYIVEIPSIEKLLPRWLEMASILINSVGTYGSALIERALVAQYRVFIPCNGDMKSNCVTATQCSMT